MESERVVIVGAGLAASEFAGALRHAPAQKACVSSPEQLSDESWPLQNLNRAAATSHTG